MDQPDQPPRPAAAAGAEDEPKIYTQRDWDLQQYKWMCRAWSLAAWPFGILVGSWLVSEIKPIEPLLVGLGGIVLLWIPAAYYWYRYSKATGKWFWI